MRSILLILLGCLATVWSSTATGQRASRTTTFTQKADRYIKQLMDSIPAIPGVVWVVVKDNEPVLVKAYGWADKEQQVSADENTLFYIASATKSFTAMAAALLDRAGTIKLDSSIAQYLPGIRFVNPVPANLITVRNLLTHTSGLQNDPLTFRMAYSGAVDNRDMAQVVANATRFIDSNYQRYNYDNLGYNIYTVLLKEYTGKAWQQLIQEQLFDPLRMRHSTAYLSRATRQRWKVAVPYNLYGPTGLTRSPLEKTDNNLQSAGGLFLSAKDAATWLTVNINKGKLNGKQVIPAAVWEACHQGYTTTQRDIEPFTGKGAYGLGWQIGDYRNDKVHYHFGGFPGYRSHISFMPEQRIGVAVFVNESGLGSQIASLLATFAYDWWLHPDKPFDTTYAKRLQDLQNRHTTNMKRYEQDYKARAARPWQLSKPLTAYTGKYVHPEYGTMEVYTKNGVLGVKMGLLNCLSTPYTSAESIRVELIPGTGQGLQFISNAQGEIVKTIYDKTEFQRQ